MQSTIRLFRAVPFEKKVKLTKEILEKTIKSGFILSPEAIGNNVNDVIAEVDKTIGLNGEKLNSSFHKSWIKIKEADIEQLVAEQIIHYFTTYGLEELGLYREECVYIPAEKLEIPEITEDIKLTIIKGYTKKELKEKLLNLLQSGIALGEDTLKDVVDVALYVGIDEKELKTIKNKEVRIFMYDYLGIIPSDPTEFLRYIIYKSTSKTLLIKDEATIEEIKSKSNLDILNLLERYKKNYGLEKLASVFYRFKPLFLAFKTNRQLNKIINKIRKLTVECHKPMPEDYLNTITAKIGNIDEAKLKEELSKVNVFRKTRLANALKYRTKDADSILYKIRNGKGYATEFDYSQKNKAKEVLDIVLDTIKVNKKVYIPENIIYSLPATEKQFTDMFPSGTCVKTQSDMIVGVHWDNVKGHRIDLDLSLISIDSKFGWDSYYRNEDRSILFSGDMTDAQRGASELFYVKKQLKGAYLLCLNYYNYDSDVEVPFDLFIAKEQVSNMKQNYMVDPNNVIVRAKSKINQKQKVLGLLVTTTQGNKFYMSEINLGRSISASTSAPVENTRKYLFNSLEGSISLNDILDKNGLLVNKKECEVDLSPENLEKDSIIKLLED